MSHPKPLPVRTICASTIPADAVVVSVVIPNYNTARYIRDAIRSALDQTYSAIEVIVVDDGSSDDSLEQIMRVQDVRLSCLAQENGGLSAARNTGIRAARGRYIALLDSDDVWHPRKLESHVGLMEHDRSIGVTFCHSAYLHDDGTPTGEFLATRCMSPTVSQLIARNHVGNGSTPVIRRECIERAGLFNEQLRSCEDWEYWVRVAALSPLRFRLVPEVLTGYRVRRDSLSVSPESYPRFIAEGLAAIAQFGRWVPNMSSAQRAAATAQLYRVTSRKALYNGDVIASRRFLREAVRQSPTAVLRDVRAWALIGYHLLGLAVPRVARRVLFEAGRSVRKCAHRVVHGAT